jgi:Domain of unknown function (DUF4287)
MSEHRVLAPTIAPGEKVMGPASYFPSIEKNYGRPVQDWLDLVVGRLETGASHMEVVDWLKSEYGMGHGHANAIVGYARAELAKSA